MDSLAQLNSTPVNRLTYLGLVALAGGQGLALFLLHLSLEHSVWPATQMPWLKALYALVVGLPAFFYLGLTRFKDWRNIAALAVLAPTLLYLGWHLGWVETDSIDSVRRHHPFTAAFVLSMGVAVFILALFFRAWTETGTWRFNAQRLIHLSWQHALTLAFVGLFALVFWMLLLLWAGLFKAINIDFFHEIFDEPAFVYPVTGIVVGLGLALIRQRMHWVSSLEFIGSVLIKALLPLASGIILLFFAALPFTGVKPIWDTGSAALLMMVLTLTLLFQFNAVFCPAEQLPYHWTIRTGVFLAIALLPVSTGLAAWALWLRVEQYGLTLDRLWAAAIQLLTAGYTLTYTALILWKRFSAPELIRKANAVLALSVVAVLVLVNTPLADFRAWAAASQTGRFLSGQVDVEEFDFHYLRFSLGRYGVLALQELRQSDIVKADDALALRIDGLLSQTDRWSSDPLIDTTDMDAVAAMLEIVPESASPSDALLQVWAEEATLCFSGEYRCAAVAVPESEGGADWLLFYEIDEYISWGTAYRLEGDEWLTVAGIRQDRCEAESEGLADFTTLHRVDGPFLAYWNAHCLYTLIPDALYMERLFERRSE